MSPFEQALILGVVQGLSEFLPISGDGHLALAQLLLEVEGGGLTLSVLLHLGTLIAATVYFRERLAAVLLDLGKQLRRGRLPAPAAVGWDAVLVLIAALPTGIIGLLSRDTIASWTAQPLVTGFGFIVTACLLTSTLWTKPGTLMSPSLSGALLLGVAQGLAVVPGVSRSGITIVAALWLGLRAERAFELSVLMSLPAVVAAIGLELFVSASHTPSALAFAAGTVTSLGFGYLSLGLLRRVLAAGAISWFALWVLPLALATLALAKAWPS
jgi:undecaprenyl-diphosphatase